MWLGAFDYTNDINSKVTFKAGVGNEYDQNVYNYYYTSYFNGDGSWPGNSTQSHYPTHIPYAYASLSFKTGKFLLNPGLRYQRMVYDIPNGPVSTGVWNPTFAGTYTMNDRDVLRFSYTDSTSFVGSGYVYRDASSVYDPLKVANFSFEPTRIHSADLMLEHQLNYNTTVKFGPWMNKADNVFYLYRPPGGPQTPSNGGMRKAFGFEGALSHVDNNENGFSYWLSGTYDNYWTNIVSSLTASYNVTPLPDYILATTPAIRSSSNPLFSASLTADLHHGRYSLLPFVYYQTGTFYQSGLCLPSGGATPANPVRSCPRTSGGVLAPTLQASAYYKANLTGLMRIGPKVREGASEQSVIGFRITNLFNNTHDVAPCVSDGTGCYPFNGPQSGINGQPGYIYQDYTQDPRRFEFFFTHKW
jgi:hypothetical protein